MVMGSAESLLAATDPVVAQYERWVYPPPCGDLSQIGFDTLGCGFNGLRTMYWAYWPDRPFRNDLDVLVAGCGTQAAAACAYFFPRCRVVGIDISAASLAHEKYLKDKHALDNLELHRCPVEDAASIGRDFDFIACHGVLHHTPDPVAGLRALKQVLRPDGVASLMVYGKYGRDGVYMLQELFRLLDLQQGPEDVALVREVLRLTGPRHPVQRYLKMAQDLSHDAGIVDAFLHKRDRAYTVSDCLELVRDAGLVFQGWDENALYYPDGMVPSNTPFRTEMEKLPEEQLWQAMELFYGNTPGHSFYACRPERPASSYRISFDGEAFLNYVPAMRITQAMPPDPSQNRPATLARSPFPAIPLNPAQTALVSRVDGVRTIAQCLSALQGPEPTKVEFARDFFKSLWRIGYAMYRIPAVDA
jgi:SAM-dependent methyltransferase